MSAIDGHDAHLEGMLELLAEAAAVVDDARRVLAINAAFRRSLRHGAALHVRDHVLQAAPAAADARLAERVAAVTRGGRERVLRLPVPGHTEALELRIAPFRGSGRALGVVVVHDAARTRAVCVARLRELYELTGAEAAVAARLADGASLDGAAALLGVSPNTVRTHVRRVFAKCGVATQAALLQRLALGAARVGTPVARDVAADVDPDFDLGDGAAFAGEGSVSARRQARVASAPAIIGR